jgi:hypothetical protein
MHVQAETGVRHAWRLLRAGPIALDAGGMFGVIPRAVWSRMVTPDARHRIELAHNCRSQPAAPPPARRASSSVSIAAVASRRPAMRQCSL